MQLTNHLPEYERHFLRRMISWICKELEISPRIIKEAEFQRTPKDRYSRRGTAWPGRMKILVRVGSDKHFPQPPRHRFGIQEWLVHPADALIFITAHELVHLDQYTRHRKSGWPKRMATREHEPERRTRDVMIAFVEKREELLEAWSIPPKRRAAAPKTRAEKNEENARAKLEEWIRKQKLANTKVRKWKQKVRYYDQRAAAKDSN